MDININQYLSIEDINKLYINLSTTLEIKRQLEISLLDISQKIEEAASKAATIPDFKWGKNETERSLQMRGYWPDLFAEQDRLQKELKTCAATLAVMHLLKEKYDMLIRYFSTRDFVV